MLDIFNTDAFGVKALTEAINLMPFQAGFIGSLGVFKDKGISQLAVLIEEKYGVLSLIPSKKRGAPANVNEPEKRKLRALVIPHKPLEDAILADDLIGIRQFGTDDQTTPVVQMVNDKLTSMKNQHELTKEHMRVSALQGRVLDADGSTVLVNLFDEFEVTEQTQGMALTTATTNVRSLCVAARRLCEKALGNAPVTGLAAICSDGFFDALVDHALVRATYLNWNEAANLRNDVRGGFEFGGIKWYNYRGGLGSIKFVPDDEARLFPIGVPDLFFNYYAPADFIEAVNTVGQPFYAKQERMQFDRGILLHTQSNPLPICTRPACLVKLTKV